MVLKNPDRMAYRARNSWSRAYNGLAALDHLALADQGIQAGHFVGVEPDRQAEFAHVAGGAGDAQALGVHALIVPRLARHPHMDLVFVRQGAAAGTLRKKKKPCWGGCAGPLRWSGAPQPAPAHAMSIELTELLAQHDRPGPRYTSYPTADRFVEAFTWGPEPGAG